jgi:chemotaxis protein MotB
MAKTRGKRRHEEHEEHEEHVNHEAWVIPYADILTLLMALFLVLFAIGRVDEEKMELAAESFRRELGGHGPVDLGAGPGAIGPLADGGPSVLDGAGSDPSPSDSTAGMDEDEDTAIVPARVVVVPEGLPGGVGPSTGEGDTERTGDGSDVDGGLDGGVGGDAADGAVGGEAVDALGQIEQLVRELAAETGLADSIGFRREARGLVVTILTDQVLFEEARAQIQPDGYRILDVVAAALIDVPNAVIIEGHTDSRPISTGQFPSNWELSTARATQVLRYLVDHHDFPVHRVSAAGYADTMPIDPGTDAVAMAKNRRVEIVVLATG